jgi:hypothetical protein
LPIGGPISATDEKLLSLTTGYSKNSQRVFGRTRADYQKEGAMTSIWNNRRTTVVAVGVALMVLVAFATVAPGRVAANDGESDDFPVLQPWETMTGIYVMRGTVAATTRTVGYIDAQINFLRRVDNHAKYKVELMT